ncbi:MAG: carboxynorspermidine decarboxylase [Ruminococcus sp.]|nr:carboxynorspermidine decarboxylase [Ruminococcus sp.]
MNYINNVKTPCYVIDKQLLIKNLEILKKVREQSGCKILLAQKAFSMYSVYPLIMEYLDGTAASGLYEARLGHEEAGNGEVHVYSPAFKIDDMKELVKICDHIVFNSPAQFKMHRQTVQQSSRKISCGLRVNPEYSETEPEIYNPCAKGSRLGTIAANLGDDDLDGIEGLHFHTMCEQGEDVLERTLPYFEEKFGKYLKNIKWVNFGGGHHITRDDYDVDALIALIKRFKDKYDTEVYLEPGEAIALNAGFLVCEVLDIVHNGMDIAIVDTSAACHMPDVLEMPYRPFIIGSGKEGEKPYLYRLGGPTCLAGDIIGDYSFDKKLCIGDRLVFCDMAIYTMVKNNTFNGMPLPSIYLKDNDELKLIKSFSYENFKTRI